MYVVAGIRNTNRIETISISETGDIDNEIFIYGLSNNRD